MKILISGEINEEVLNNVFYSLSEAEEGEEIEIFLNSHGGDPEVSLALYNILSKYDTSCTVVGQCMSAATDILLACDKRYCFNKSLFMIHDIHINASVSGTKRDINKNFNEMPVTDFLIGANEDILLRRTKLTKKKLDKILKKDYFFNPEKAKKFGFVHGIL